MVVVDDDVVGACYCFRSFYLVSLWTIKVYLTLLQATVVAIVVVVDNVVDVVVVVNVLVVALIVVADHNVVICGQ